MKATHHDSERRRGFTLIELLIVVAIIAILAAIAVPNFLEAQTRAKVSRVRTDLRSIATALESYRVDNKNYPPTPFCAVGPPFGGLLRVVPNRLSTPIAYISTANFFDPFIDADLGDFNAFTTAGNVDTYSPDPGFPNEAGGDPLAGRRYYYQSNLDDRRVSFTPEAQAEAREVEGHWVLSSIGTDKARNLITHPSIPTLLVLQPYDPTNGTISDGDIVRSQKESEGSLNP